MSSKISRKMAQLFDLMFKSIIKDASSSAVVHLINGIYKKSYRHCCCLFIF